MFFDVRSPVFQKWVNQAAVVTYPLRAVVDAPVRLSQWLIRSMQRQQILIDQNAKLKVQALLLQSRLQKLMILEKENQQLYHLLQASAQVTGKVKVSRIMAIDLQPALHQLVLDSGKNQGVYIGQPVLDGFGVMGQVVAVSPFTSRVLMITDKQFAIPVKDFRNGLRFIAVGSGKKNGLSLLNVTRTDDIKVGDRLVSSGFALRFPVGYPVGQVVTINRQSHTPFLQVALMPTAHLNQTQQVLLAWPKQARLRHAVIKQLATPLQSKDTKS